MQTEKQRIFDEYAKEQRYTDWDHLQMDYECNLMSFDEFKLFMFEACDLVQQEQQKRIAENVKALRVTILNPEYKIR